MNSSSEIPEIAIYDHYHTFLWPKDNLDSFRNRTFLDIDSYRICPYCRHKMIVNKDMSAINHHKDYVLLCPQCGFWFGKGTRKGAYSIDTPGGRGVIGKIRFEPLDSLTLPIPELIRNINSHPKYLTKINPYKAEELVCHILEDSIDSEVIHIGGRKDNGIDAYLVVNDEIKSIVQVKWHQNTRKAESVSLVREFAGTLLARGVPNGLIVTTREKFSVYAKNEIKQIENSKLNLRENIKIDCMTYSDILDLLEISHRKINENPIIPIDYRDVLFNRQGLHSKDKRHVGRMSYCKTCDTDIFYPENLDYVDNTKPLPKGKSLKTKTQYFQTHYRLTYQQSIDLAKHIAVPPGNCHHCNSIVFQYGGGLSCQNCDTIFYNQGENNYCKACKEPLYLSGIAICNVCGSLVLNW